MSQAIFTYGSLMFAPVWKRVVQARYVSARAEVHGYARHAIQGVSYPAAIACAPASIQGTVYWPDARQAQDPALLVADIAALDRFEDRDYERRTVSLRLLEPLAHWEAGSQIEANMYVFLRLERVLPEAWDPEWFATQGLPEFMRSYVARRGPL
jgi:gamma-glutamylcyclotransferase (GGCT)/AIG2-like uncharacterized protein YtfP